ncbi:Pseudouridine-5'-phosphate glycosidase [Acholeplasma oculi]|uniref:Pseudouridine-5'-phosphate glycosidase n=1 Tax=Acholeplasma oculi TaxID=35623 RepID=A0A061AH91_9MOLU|nr:pseudouridine-5'-phosphate glycosidase [Acholeplasma oculi]CDR30986.1 Pseudouridine 5'-phosphate glycosidase [Acholeplasma oculi]SKC36032.1 pseudouridine-5'-phosphate glycosidase [Acholeplasma oculi]SUT90384.1 Pseudouridine-5'-phosphate glycosidase [Acholeplasma oculi]
MQAYIDIHPKVLQGIRTGKPIVALESTIIAFGMPYPKNVETALSVEKIIEHEGAIPATIGILNGRIKVGMKPDEITQMASSKQVIKVSKRDIAFCLSKKRIGATTVSGTLLIADMVGIKVFATGGIGGVHKNAIKTFDISRDLDELSTSNCLVVSSGAKSILDLELTNEVLETKGVDLIGYNTNEFPAFYHNHSGIHIPYMLDKPEEIAEMMHIKWSLGLRGSILVVNPIPKIFELDQAYINQVIDTAITKQEQLGIEGKMITPYLLNEIEKITEGKSLETNIQLIYHNAKVAANIAVAYSKFL